MSISPQETVIRGGTLFVDGRVLFDEQATRIDDLIRKELELLGKDYSGWDALYRDPADGRLWERVFLQSAIHGGGPPTLQNIDAHTARLKYKLPELSA